MKQRFLAILATGLLAMPMAANATILWSFSYSGSGIDASGTLQTADTMVNGGYLVTGVSGQRNGDAILGVVDTGAAVPGFTWDNMLFPGAAYAFDTGGLMYSTASGNFNVCSNTAPIIAGCGNSGYQEFETATNTMRAVQFSVTRVPEPSTLALFGLGLLGLGFSRRRKNS